MHRNIILFDLDGTLTDSGPGIMKAGQYALRAFGIERDWRELSFFVGHRPDLRQNDDGILRDRHAPCRVRHHDG